jgi:enhancing lycopene biosynthesis protein 2
VNHLNGEEMNESRNMLVEAARIARGNIVEISKVAPADLDGLVIPGGFGSAKNFSKWAFAGPNGEINPKVKLLIVNMINVGKPIAALCVSPVVVAKALEGSSIHPKLTIGSDKESSPYDIEGFSAGLRSTGASTEMKTIHEILIDSENKIITAPCYMMDASIVEIRKNIRNAIEALRDLI